MVIYLRRLLTIRKEKPANEIQLRFLQRLHRLLANGYPLLSALEIMKWDNQLIRPATRIITCLKNGSTVDHAFEEGLFHHTITSYLYFVRSNGDLEGSIKKCIEMYEHRMNYTKKFQQIARYPLILFVIFSLLLYFIKQSVLPSFAEIFQNTDASATIRISINIIDFLGALGILIIAVTLAGFIMWRFMKHKMDSERQIQLLSTIPIYRKFLRLQTSFLFAMHFNTLLKTGMSFKEILHQMAKQQKLPIIAHYSRLMTAELTKGLHITYLLSQFTLFEKQLAAIFQKNTDTDALEKDLSVYAELLMEEIQRKIIRLFTYIQPVFFLILASFIIFIYITLMWPMFELINTI
ncbi:chromosome partitioning protein ParA [Virgibacillus profundi]|uniref:Chromosome partitioning protein ParA n=1 Tax=Virgibacillus profundi TaxID=2024555 RepID=A0A2A2ICI6_9BACI|nr:competence type IV pilus assembly protein ComGB [Virgibacillus profundi]PAV29078.1 chromosome partitioning protein ParA [Virgibacillus profundi]PXY53247.1 chromosome partitioning protein ParA [Virgibacillus profundi]